METSNRNLDAVSSVEVLGDGIFAMLNAFSNIDLCKKMLETHGLSNVQKGEFYPMASWISVLHEVQDKMPTVARKIGTHIVIEAPFPPMVDFERVLMDSDKAFYMNHRGYEKEEIGHYHCEKRSDVEYLFTVSCPYPCMFNQGIIFGYAQRFGANVTVEHADDRCTTKGDSECCFRIRLES